jgi:neuroligin
LVFRFLAGFAPFADGAVLSLAGDLPDAGLGSRHGPGHELAEFAERDLLFGLTTTESYLDLSAQDLEFGFDETRRDRILRTFVRNSYTFHLNEIFSTLKNEYTDWERSVQNPLDVRDATLEVLSDGHTVAPLVKLGYLHASRGGRTYFLHFDHMSNDRDFPQVQIYIFTIIITIYHTYRSFGSMESAVVLGNLKENTGDKYH